MIPYANDTSDTQENLDKKGREHHELGLYSSPMCALGQIFFFIR